MAEPVITVFGGSGFIGRYLVKRLAASGARVRVAVRNPGAAGFLRPMGDVGQVAPIQANVGDEASVAAAVAGTPCCSGLTAPRYGTQRNATASPAAHGASQRLRIRASRLRV